MNDRWSSTKSTPWTESARTTISSCACTCRSDATKRTKPNAPSSWSTRTRPWSWWPAVRPRKTMFSSRSGCPPQSPSVTWSCSASGDQKPAERPSTTKYFSPTWTKATTWTCPGCTRCSTPTSRRRFPTPCAPTLPSLPGSGSGWISPRLRQVSTLFQLPSFHTLLLRPLKAAKAAKKPPKKCPQQNWNTVETLSGKVWRKVAQKQPVQDAQGLQAKAGLWRPQGHELAQPNVRLPHLADPRETQRQESGRYW